jgi:hypothetical protein
MCCWGHCCFTLATCRGGSLARTHLAGLCLLCLLRQCWCDVLSHPTVDVRAIGHDLSRLDGSSWPGGVCACSTGRMRRSCNMYAAPSLASAALPPPSPQQACPLPHSPPLGGNLAYMQWMPGRSVWQHCLLLVAAVHLTHRSCHGMAFGLRLVRHFFLRGFHGTNGTVGAHQ